MKTIVLGVLCSFALLAQQINIESDETANFAGFHTFAIRGSQLNSKNPALNSDLIRQKIDGDIRKALEAKGLTFVATGRSDLNVRYTLGAVRKVEAEAYPAGWRGWGT